MVIYNRSQINLSSLILLHLSGVPATTAALIFLYLPVSLDVAWKSTIRRKPSFEGKRCIDMPGVRLELVQLTTPGPPATQYLPETLRFRLFAIFPATIYTTDDVTKKFWPRGNCRIFWATMTNFWL